MSSFSEGLGVLVKGHVKIIDETNGVVLLDKTNAVHPQNMARVIARTLANENNSTFYRLAFGDGGTFVDAGLNVNTREPNDGTNGAGWEARLYREIYSEVIDNNSANFGTDPGSAGPDNIRTGGGASPSSDPTGLGVSSEETGRISNVIVNMTINESEPNVQGVVQDFVFDEIGIYSEGKPAISTSGVSSIDVGVGKNSASDIVDTDSNSILAPNVLYSIRVTVDGVQRDSFIRTPAAGSGTGGEFTYGDLCEGINSSDWYDSGFNFAASNGAFFYITDNTGGDYPTITGQESQGLFTVQSKSTGAASTIEFPKATTSSAITNVLYLVANMQWSRANINQFSGENAGLINSDDSDLERERLLTHLVFSPITKSTSSIVRVIYTITIETFDCAITDYVDIISPTVTPTPSG